VREDRSSRRITAVARRRIDAVFKAKVDQEFDAMLTRAGGASPAVSA
jgi:hypothetical protein